MGLYFSALFLVPFLNIGVTYVIFQSCGIHPSSMVLFRTKARGLDTRPTNSIKIWDAFRQVHIVYLYLTLIFRTGPFLL